MQIASTVIIRVHAEGTVSMIYIGIDPGAKGGISFIQYMDNTRIGVHSYSMQEMLTQIKGVTEDETFCVLEKVHSMPQQGVKSTFNFGVSFGYIKGVLETLDIPYQEVPPQAWKREFNLIGTDKKASIACAQRLFPHANLLATTRSRVPSDGMAESLLMAEYARRKHNGSHSK